MGNSIKQGKSLVKNSIINTVYQFLSIVMPIFTAPYVSRVLMADGVGVASYLNSLVTYFVLVAALGTVSYGTMRIAKQRDDKQSYSKTFWEIELLQFNIEHAKNHLVYYCIKELAFYKVIE